MGGVAQLGERLPCTQEVIGSIPFTSTIFLMVVLKSERWKLKVWFSALSLELWHLLSAICRSLIIEYFVFVVPK